LLGQLFHSLGERITIEPPFHCDYGDNIKIGNDFFANFGCVFLDCNEITIGNNVMMASYVQFYTAHHPLDAATRNSGLELASPIKIGNSVWIGGGAIILPGVEIGDEAVIGAGSVVSRSIPPRVVAVGNPCRVIKQL
jgi:maltose O-acetyltransferase